MLGAEKYEIDARDAINIAGLYHVTNRYGERLSGIVRILAGTEIKEVPELSRINYCWVVWLSYVTICGRGINRYVVLRPFLPYRRLIIQLICQEAVLTERSKACAWVEFN